MANKETNGTCCNKEVGTWQAHPTVPHLRTVTIKSGNLVKVYEESMRLRGIDPTKAARSSHDKQREGWFGATRKQIREMLDYGALDRVKRAEAFRDQVARELKIETKHKELRAVPNGGAVIVPAAIAGHPLAFMRAMPTESPRAPIRVFINTSSSHDVSAQAMETRGLAVLAFASLLSATRPVELIAFCYQDLSGGPKATCTKVTLGLAPINWGMAGAVIGGCEVARDCLYNVSRDVWDTIHGCSLGAPNNHNVGADAVALCANEKDVIIRRAHSSYCDISANPVQWVQEALEAVANGETVKGA